jgi:branched-chain amino acid transport system ATP-binding protein
MMLQVQNLDVHYGPAQILHGVSLTLGGTAPLAVVGRNGMGKTTLCHAIMGLATTSAGEIRLDDQRLTRAGACRVARSGIAIVPQGRRVFPSLSVDEHLKLAARRRDGDARWTIDRVYATFARLAERRRSAGSQLSGGEQQMLAIARALLMNPRLVIMDEPSEGLAPVIVDQLVGVLRHLADDGIALLLVEQNLRVATAVAESVAVMVNGRIAVTLPSARLLEDEALQSSYLGIARSHHHH